MTSVIYNTEPEKRLIAEEITKNHDTFWLLFILFHIPIAIVLKEVPALGIAHAWLVLGYGAITTIISHKDSPRPLYTMGYLVGSEVVWRICGLDPLVPWFASGYGICVLALIGISKRYSSIQKWPVIPFLYILVLLPSFILVMDKDLVFLRRSVLENILGPLVLGLVSIYLYRFPITRQHLKHFSFIAVGPICAVWALSVHSTLTSDVFYGRSSNPEVTAGFGPNQVSNTLSYGVMLCWLLILTVLDRYRERFILLLLSFSFLFIMLLSFSRGGVVTLALLVPATLIMSTNLKAGKKARTKTGTLVISFVVVFFVAYIWSVALSVTEGSLYDRYFEGSDSGRTDILASEIALWFEHPLFGVGPGGTTAYLNVRTHTEFSRLLAEHGFWGIIAIVLLLIGPLRQYKGSGPSGKIWIVAAFVFTVMYFLQAATRTVAPIVIYGTIWLDFSKAD